MGKRIRLNDDELDTILEWASSTNYELGLGHKDRLLVEKLRRVRGAPEGELVDAVALGRVTHAEVRAGLRERDRALHQQQGLTG